MSPTAPSPCSPLYSLPVVHTVPVVILVVKMGGSVGSYLPSSTFSFVIGGAGSHLLSFLLFWTLSYALVHIY